MKRFRKILFCLYFTIASVVLILVIIYNIRHYHIFKEEHRFESDEYSFVEYYLNFSNPETGFVPLFSIPRKKLSTT
jgi:hypothetical protein